MKQMATCQICGKQVSARGLVGHMRFAHGKDWKAPVFDLAGPKNMRDAKRYYSALERLKEDLKSPAFLQEVAEMKRKGERAVGLRFNAPGNISEQDKAEVVLYANKVIDRINKYLAE